MAVQLSRGIYVSVQHVHPDHVGVHRVRVFLHRSCCDGLPRVAVARNQKNQMFKTPGIQTKPFSEPVKSLFTGEVSLI